MIVHIEKVGQKPVVEVRCNTCRDKEGMEGLELYTAQSDIFNKLYAEDVALYHETLKQGFCLITVSFFSPAN